MSVSVEGRLHDVPMNDQVYTAALENASYFRDHSSFNGKALNDGFELLAIHCQDVGPLLDRIRLEAPNYDLDAETPGNGFRSFLVLFDACFARSLVLCQLVSRQRYERSFFLYTAQYIEDLNAWNDVLLTLRTILDQLKVLLDWNAGKDQRKLLVVDHPLCHQFLLRVMSIRRYSFYGRHAGFPYCPKLEQIFKHMLTFLASYSDYYFNPSNRWRRVFDFVAHGTRYILDTEHRARRIINVSQFASVEFCKSFWFLAQSNFLKQFPLRLCPSLQVIQVIAIPPEPLQIPSNEGQVIDVPVPCAHGAAASIPVRLLSAKRRPGMPGLQDQDSDIPVSNFLVIHCHGGGFIAQDSQSHECYLRDWAVALDVPILSIDYSLAPEFPFPRQLQEILYVYAWAIRNHHILGTTADKIIFAGDSAGGNMIAGAMLWASDLNMRLPVGLFLAYSPLLIRMAPSPSRLLCLMDPLLPLGFMTRCLKAYAGHVDISAAATKSEEGDPQKGANNNTVMDDKDLAVEEEVVVDPFTDPKSPYLSPNFASDAALRKMPPMSLLSVELDPCLDDCVEFAKRCRRLGCDVTLDVLPGLPHGFLNFSLLSSEAKEGSKLCVQRISELIEKAEPDF